VVEQSARKNRWGRFVALPAIAALSLASYWTIRLAYADQRFRAPSLDSLGRAARLAPGNAQYFAWLAEYREAEGLDPGEMLETASRLNPLDSSVWIRRGLRAEFQRDFANAEKFLLEAARVDKLFEPRAALVNFYFRRNSPEPFWRWMREALAIGYGDLTSLYRLCWRMTDDPKVIRRRASPPLRSYLSFLLAENKLDAAEPIARTAGSEDAPLLLDFIDRSLTQGKPSVIEFSQGSLTNGSFRSFPTSRGFDWRLPHSDEISAVRIAPRGLRIDLSGKQPEQCELLAQYVALTSGKTCRLRFSYQTSAPAESGLRWRILDSAGPQLSSADWKQADWPFSTQDAPLARLSLEYSRVPGTPRLEGSIALRDLELSCAP
jgi:tetratricopeptide (TPR) repeat protein